MTSRAERRRINRINAGEEAPYADIMRARAFGWAAEKMVRRYGEAAVGRVVRQAIRLAHGLKVKHG